MNKIKKYHYHLISIFRIFYKLKQYIQIIFSKHQEIYAWDRKEFYKKLWKEASVKLKASFREIDIGFWEVQKNSKKLFFSNHEAQLDDHVLLKIAGDKPLCFKIFKELKISTPEYIIIYKKDFRDVENFIEENNSHFFVVKPAKGTAGGMGVSIFLDSYSKILRAISLASLFSDQVLLENHIAGENYRLLFFNGEFLHAVRRTGIRIKGNDSSSIIQLIKNYLMSKERFSKKNIESFIKNDKDFLLTITSQGKDWNSILPNEKEFLVRGLDEFENRYVEKRAVYDADVTELIHESIIKDAKKVVDYFGFKLVGVDIITPDAEKPLSESGGVINEINTTPALHHHYNLKSMKSNPDLAYKIVNYLISGGNSFQK